MKKNELSELTLEEIYKKKKTLQGITIGFGIVMLAALSIIIYLAFKKQNFTLVAIVPACLMMLLPGFITLGKINAEIKSRKSN